MKMKKILEDKVFLNVAKNAGVLLKGNIFANIIGLISLVLTTNHLGPKNFGIIIIIQTYCLVFDQIFNFQSWQALIKLGTGELEKKNFIGLKKLIKLSSFFDISSAAIATLFAILFFGFSAPILNLDEEYYVLVALYSLTILFNLTGTPTGILRIYNKYRIQSIQQIYVATIRLLGIILVIFYDGGLSLVLLSWIIAEVTGNLLLLYVANKVLKDNGLDAWVKQPFKFNREFFSFAFWTNLTSTLDVPVRRLDNIIIATVMSFEGVAIYKVFKQIAQILTKLANPIYQVIFPDFSKMVAKSDNSAALNLATKVSVILAIIVFPVIIFASFTSQWWLVLFGNLYADYWNLLFIYLLIKGVSISFISIHPLFISLGLVKKNVIIILIANLLFTALAILLGKEYELLGVILAYGVQVITVITLKIYFTLRTIKVTRKHWIGSYANGSKQ